MTGYDSVYKWVNVLKNNNTMHGIAGYHKSAPSRGDAEIMEKFIGKLNDGKTFVEAWKSANGGSINLPLVNNANWGCLIKEGYDETIDKTMSCQTTHSYNNFILYRYEQKNLEIPDVQSYSNIIEEVKSSSEVHYLQEEKEAISIANDYLENEKLKPISIISQKTERLNTDGEIIEILDNKYTINYVEMPNNSTRLSLDLTNTFSLEVDLNENTVEYIQ